MKNNTQGFSSARLEALTSRIQSDIEAGRIPGAVMMISHNGQTVYEHALGRQDPASDAPMRPDSIFRIYSMSKPIVSVAAMMLVEQGRLQLADPVAGLLPELANPKVGVEKNGELELVPARQPITLQDLLRHTSGLTYGVFGDSLVKAEYRKAGVRGTWGNSDAFMAMMGKLPLMYQPGTVWEYSHSTDVLGVLLERATGKPLDVLLDEMILQPLGMRETGFWVKPENHHRIAEPFDIDPVARVPAKLIDVRKHPGFFCGGNGMVSTLADYTRFTHMLANGGELDGVRLLARKTVELMTSDHLVSLPLAKTGQNYTPGGGYGFGLGFAVRTSAGGAPVPGSVGDFHWSGLSGTYFWIDPTEKLFAIFLMQAPEQRQYYRQLFRNMVYAALE